MYHLLRDYLVNLLVTLKLGYRTMVTTTGVVCLGYSKLNFDFERPIEIIPTIQNTFYSSEWNPLALTKLWKFMTRLAKETLAHPFNLIF